MSVLPSLFRYFAALTPGKIVLWCYLIWYLVTVYNHFDPTPVIWLNSLGISTLVGIALLLSVSNHNAPRANHWQTFRLFLMPFCVSSFSSLIKGQGYWLILPPSVKEQGPSIGLCALFVGAVIALKQLRRDDRDSVG